jgi:tetratricopeptide (TPR) repeat protein
MIAGQSKVIRVAFVVAMACTLSLGLTAAGAEPLTPQRQHEILHDALNAFDQAVSVARDDAARAEALYRESAAAFETLLSSGLRNPALHYDLGNAYFRLGKLGRAILHYRRAQRLDPTDGLVATNLQYARNRVEPYVAPTSGQRLLHRLMFWASHTSVRVRFWLAAILSMAGWVALAVWLRWRSGPLLILACLGIVLGLANAGSVAWQLHDETARPPAVVVDGQHVLRLGRGEGYDPAVTQPLGPGVELRILSERGEWVEVELRDGKTGWLPSAAVERV